MGALLAVAIVLIAAGAISGATMTAFRRERKSIDKHKKVMGVISHVSSNPSPDDSYLNEGASRFGIAHVQPSKGSRESTAHKAGQISTNPREQVSRAPNLVKQNSLAHPESPASESASQFVFEENAPASGLPLGVRKERVFGEGHWSEFMSNQMAKIAALTVLLMLGVTVSALGLDKLVSSSGTTKRTAMSTTTQPRSKVTSSSTPTTTGVRSYISPNTQTPQGAVFLVPSGVMHVVLAASSPCWVEQSSSPVGKVLWDAVLSPGAGHMISSSAPLWLRAGNSKALSITINGLPVHFTSPPGPYDFTFEATSASSGSTA